MSSGNEKSKSYWNKAKNFPFYLLLVYFFIEYIRPQDQYPIIASTKFSLIISVMLVALWLIKGNKQSLKEPLIILYILFLFLMIQGVFSATNTFWVVKSFQNLTTYLLAGVLPVIAFLNKPESIRLFFRYWVLIQTLLAIYSITHNGTGPGGVLLDENDLALALNMAIPYAYFLIQSPGTKIKGKVFFTTCLVLLIYAVVSTDSRGGFVGLIAAAIGIILFSKHLLRNVVIITLATPIFLFFVSPSYLHDIKSIQDTTDATRQDRLYSWRRGWEMFLDHPIVGVGAGNYPWNVEEYELKSSEYDPRKTRLHGGRVAHSLYFTLIPELGTLGVIVYFWILLLIYKNIKKINDFEKNNP
jgi:O-antigen ligase